MSATFTLATDADGNLVIVGGPLPDRLLPHVRDVNSSDWWRYVEVAAATIKRATGVDYREMATSVRLRSLFACPIDDPAFAEDLFRLGALADFCLAIERIGK